MQEPPAIAGGERALESAGTFQSLARVHSQAVSSHNDFRNMFDPHLHADLHTHAC